MDRPQATTLPSPQDLPFRVGDDVEFLTDNSLVLRRGVVLFFMDGHRCAVRVHDTVERQRLFKPREKNIRRVYREGVEVARQPWRLEDPVPLPREAQRVTAELRSTEKAIARNAAWPNVNTLRTLPSPMDFKYKAEDVVLYEGKMGNMYKGRVSMITPADEGCEPVLRLVVESGGVTYPRFKQIRRVWRAGTLVAVDPLLVPE